MSEPRKIYHDVRPHLQVEQFGFAHRPDGMHEVVLIRWGDGREVEVTVSPKGQSVRVYLDGKRMKVNPKNE